LETPRASFPERRPRGRWLSREEKLPDGTLLVEERNFDQIDGTVENDHCLVEADGGRESASYTVRYVCALSRSGYSDGESFGCASARQ